MTKSALTVGDGAIDVPKSSLDKTYVYEYNSNGNIVCAKTYAYTLGELGTVKSQKSYIYSETQPDRLIDCDGTSITYNAIGCPTTYDGYTTGWTRGKLSSLTIGSRFNIQYRYTFSYNALGQRTQKEYWHPIPSSGTTAVMKGELTRCIRDYCYDESGRLISEHILSQYYQEGNGVDDLVYLYDGDMIIGVVHTSVPGATNTYYFERNLLGDVIAIYDTSGNRVSAYAYDAWGNCRIDENVHRITTLNPIRYRGYYYDQDTNLYYLNARYYCPEWRRFISPDDTSYLDPETPNGLNLYAYCNNDPVNYCDPSGHFAVSTFLIGLAVTSLVSWGLSEIFGSQIVGGASPIANGAGAIKTGISLCYLGPWGIVAGVALIVVGGATIAFGANEIVDGVTGTNYIQEWTGMSDGWYAGLYTGLNIASSVGTIAGNMHLNRIRANALNGLDDATYGPKAAEHVGDRSYYNSKLTQQEIIKGGQIRKAKYGVRGYEFRIKGYTVMGKSGNIHTGTWSLVYGDGTIWHFLLK